MPPLSAHTASSTQTGRQISELIESFLAEHPAAIVLEDGDVIFDMRETKFSLSVSGDERCAFHLWSEDRNLVRRVSSAELRNGALRLAITRFGHTRQHTLEITPQRDRRTPGSRDATRTRYLRLLDRVLTRHFPELGREAFRSAMDLERSFGPAYARGTLVRGRQAWAVVAINAEEAQTTIDGILTIGILWLAHCREQAAGSADPRSRRHVQGLRLILPSGTAATTLSRLAWLNPQIAQYELYELNENSEDLRRRDPSDHGNLTTRLVHAPNEAAALDRFSSAMAEVIRLLPPGTEVFGLNSTALAGTQPPPQPLGSTPSDTVPAHRSNAAPVAGAPACEVRLRSSAELAFLLHGLEFARIRSGYAGQSFNRHLETTVGAGQSETPLSGDTESDLREKVHLLFARRTPFAEPGAARPDKRDPLFRLQPERWLESVLRSDIAALDPQLQPSPVYTQVPAFTGAGHSLDRGMLDLLAVTRENRLAVIELKADEDLHLALQGLDYWIRVRHHHLANIDSSSGLGDLQQHGYFPQTRLSAEPPLLYLAAPALRIHPATETILRYFDPRVTWTLIALDERWRTRIKPVWRKRSSAR